MIQTMNINAESFIYKMLYGPRIIIVTGHFGSGKTEFSVSLALFLSRLMQLANDAGCCDFVSVYSNPQEEACKLAYECYGRYVQRKPQESYLSLADLDVENPYFRSREKQKLLKAYGVKIYSDIYGGRNASELQTVDASILAPIEDSEARLIIDTGGNDTGAMILNQFSRHFHDNYQMLQLINCNRPGTDTIDKAIAQIKATEEITGLKVSGLVSNAHFLAHTTREDVLCGYDFTRELSRLSGIPVLCACAKPDIYKNLTMECEQFLAKDEYSVYFPIGMYMRDSYLDKCV